MQLPYQHDRYLLLEELAQGGMATVYRGKYIGPEGFARDVAIKRIRPEWACDHDFITMLIDEARVLTQLQHQNIVPVYELGADAGVYFIVMEYVAGFDLRTLLTLLREDQVRLPERFAYAMTMEVLQGLAFAHTQVDAMGQPLGLVHRDISPQNILISLQGEVKIADFGIAKGSHRSLETAGAQVKGKYAYMAPEQARGERVDRRADVFSTGVVLYELLTGQTLFSGPNDLAVLERVREARLPRGWEADIHPTIRSLLRRALANALPQRFPTAASFLSELAGFVRHHRITTNRVEMAAYLRDLFPGVVAREQRRAASSLPEAFAKQFGGREATHGYTAHGAVFGASTSRRHFALGRAALLTIPLALGNPFMHGSGREAQAALHPPVRVVLERPAPLPLPPPPPIVWQLPPPVVARMPQAVPRESVAAPPTGLGTLAVNVRPWGTVAIPGVSGRREAPTSFQLAAGSYTVTVHGGDGRALRARATIRPGTRTTCLATFSDPPKAWCR
ncbi:MAG: serine/threonine protein kinase [Deltaproteobacteria bacterium]|nr:serine/threonine protein kinase [Deltaproteobacteria bacterium]